MEWQCEKKNPLGQRGVKGGGCSGKGFAGEEEKREEQRSPELQGGSGRQKRGKRSIWNREKSLSEAEVQRRKGNFARHDSSHGPASRYRGRERRKKEEAPLLPGS